MTRYAKAVVAAIGAAATVLVGVLPEHSTWSTVLTAVLGALTAAGVYQVPNAAAATTGTGTLDPDREPDPDAEPVTPPAEGD